MSKDLNAYRIKYMLRRRGLDIYITGIVIASSQDSAVELVEKASREKRENMEDEYSFKLINVFKVKYDYFIIEQEDNINQKQQTNGTSSI